MVPAIHLGDLVLRFQISKIKVSRKDIRARLGFYELYLHGSDTCPLKPLNQTRRSMFVVHTSGWDLDARTLYQRLR